MQTILGALSGGRRRQAKGPGISALRWAILRGLGKEAGLQLAKKHSMTEPEFARAEPRRGSQSERRRNSSGRPFLKEITSSLEDPRIRWPQLTTAQSSPEDRWNG